ncbi:hypothetical protein OV079_51595 [Nannocystis pusilla]|uniref:Uncharacterized protein n=1 Tax=Nannocystis pusilla TaxID=889268 RepID=A0A9X3F9G2_9BACT|nr:hypothetical protein [Nannocystis pusilla]MCY1013836.1 hypothetical protein [Nannocystis pusilla]
MFSPPRRFIFSLRLTGVSAVTSTAADREEWERETLWMAERQLPDSDPDDDEYGLQIRTRRLGLEELAEHLAPITLVEADFLGPVFAGFEVSLTYRYALADINRHVTAALSRSAWECGGPVIRVEDGEVRHGIDRVTFPAEVLAEQPCFGENVLLRLPLCDAYHAHVSAAVHETLVQSGVKASYLLSTGRKEHVKLCFDRYPERPDLSFWRRLFTREPTVAELLRGHEFTVIAHDPDLAHDGPFWRSRPPGP